MIRFRDIEDMLLADGSDLIVRVHNVSEDYDCDIQDADSNLMLTLKPQQQSGPILVAMEQGGTGGEIHFLNPPARHLILRRGISLPNMSDATPYTVSSDAYRSLPFSSNTIVYRDADAISAGSASDPASGILADVDVSDWDIKGSYQILRAGWVNIRLRYRIAVEVGSDTALGSFEAGHGPSIWLSEEGTGDLERDHFNGQEEFGGIGAVQECRTVYRGLHAANTRFVFFHRVPSGSDFSGTVSGTAYNNHDHIKFKSVQMDFTLEPEIRKVIG